jgi:rhomboid protease GluP
MHTMLLYFCLFSVLGRGFPVLVEYGAGEAAPPLMLARRFWRRPVPVVAVVLVAVQVIMGVVQLVHPAIIGTLERDPDGGWWRNVTALLVQSDGGIQLVFNLAAMIAVAPVAARTLGTWRTVAIFLISGVAAQVVSTLGWSPRGGGDSVAICGLVGALAVLYALRGREAAVRGREAPVRGREAPVRGREAPVRGREALMGARRTSTRWSALIVPAAGVLLCVLHNNHGVGLVVGSLLGAALAVRSAPTRVARQS